MSGHIRRSGKKSWLIKFDIGRDPISGKRKQQYRTVKGTRREAQAELTRLLAQVGQGHYVDPVKTTIAEFLDIWLRDWAAPNTSPTTVQRYRQLINNQIKPHIGQLPIQKLRPIHLTQFYGLLLREGRFDQRNKNAAPGLSARTIGHCHRVLHRALRHAVTWGVIQQNVAAAVEPPRVEDTEIEILREADVKDLLEKLRGRMLYLVAVIGLATGMRRGEMLALRRQDVDLTRGQIRVEQSLQYTNDGGLRFKAPKTKRGRRTISIPPVIVAELRARFAQQQEQWLALGLGRVPDDALVFATEEAATRSPNALSKDWSETMAALGIKATLHSLRHTHVSQLIAAGVDVVTISRRLGHASPVITLATYAHLFGNTGDDRAATVIEESFAKLRD